MNSLYKQQLFAIFAVMSGAFLLLTISMLAISRSFIYEQFEGDAKKNAQFLAAYTTAFIQHKSIGEADYQTYVKTVALVADSFIFVTALEGNDSYATDGTDFYPIKRNDVSRGVVDALVESTEYEGYTDLGGIFTEERYIYGVTYSQNVQGAVVPQGIVVISPNSERFTSLWNGFANLFFWITVAVVSLTLVALSYLSKRQMKPINELASTARRFGEGELDLRIKGYENRSDEIGALTREFNAMASSLRKVDEQRNGFISNVSHELNTPMTTIAGFVEALLDGTVPEEKRNKTLEIVAKETRRLSRLVKQMLEISRLEQEEDTPLVQEEFDLIEVIAQVIISMESKILGRNLDVDVDIPEGELLVWGNPDGITQVCYNLLDNAAKFAHPHTTITITVRIHGKKVLVSVENVGEPLEAEGLPLLFQQFHKGDYSRHNHPEGLGLGLYIVKTIMVKLKESITVASVDGVTRFTFTLSMV